MYSTIATLGGITLVFGMLSMQYFHQAFLANRQNHIVAEDLATQKFIVCATLAILATTTLIVIALRSL